MHWAVDMQILTMMHGVADAKAPCMELLFQSVTIDRWLHEKLMINKWTSEQNSAKRQRCTLLATILPAKKMPYSSSWLDVKK